MRRSLVLMVLSASTVMGVCPAAHADMTGLGAFVGVWKGHGGKIVVDTSGNVTKTVQGNATGYGSTVTYRITAIRTSMGNVVADYTGVGSGSLTFFCWAAQDPKRGDVAMDGWELHYSASEKLRDATAAPVVQTRRAQYCAQNTQQPPAPAPNA